MRFLIRRAHLQWLGRLVLLGSLFGCGSSGDLPNVILITMDTTRADRLGCYGCEFASTPVLDSISHESTLFENAFAAAPITLPSHMTMLTGRTPIGHGIRANGWHSMVPDLPTLTEVLAARGYTTAAFISAHVLKASYDVARGFQVYDDELVTERTAAETTDRAIAYLEQQSMRPLFLWVHYFDPHHPYTPPEPFASTTRGVAYDAEISAMDCGIGRLLAALEHLGYAEDAHILLVADHGEGLGDRDGYMDHGLQLYEEAIRVPFLWHTPGQESGRRDTSLVGCVDIYATTLDLLGIDCPIETEGISLRPQLTASRAPHRDGIYCETVSTYELYNWSPLFCWRTPNQKYIAASVPEFYALSEDPGELRNLAPRRSVHTARMHAALRAYMDRWRQDAAGVTGPLTEEERAALESIGYIQPARRKKGPQAPTRIPQIGEFDGLASPRDHIAAEGLFTDIIQARRFEDWERVVDDYEAILAKLPESPAVPLGLAEALLEVGRPAEALLWLRRHLEFRPSDSSVQRWVGDALLATGQYAEASSAYARVAPEDVDTELMLARVRIAVMLGNPERAREQFRILREAFSHQAQIDVWEQAVDLLAHLGTMRPAATDNDLTRQVQAMLRLGLSSEARNLLAACGKARPDSLIARLHGDIAYTAQDWCAAREAYARAAALGLHSISARLAEVERRCRQQSGQRQGPLKQRP